MPAKTPSVSIVLLCYSRPDTLEAALRSIESQSYPVAQVLVVDNRSPQSGRIATIVGQHPGATLIANPVNGGFTGGMNLGLRHAAGEYVLLTEEDIILAPDCVQQFVDHATANPAPAILSGIMTDDQDRILSAGGWIRMNAVYRLDLIARGERYSDQFKAPFDVGYLTGAMMFARRDVWVALGGFRQDFFLYHDDTDLSLRALEAGFRLIIVPRARERHLSVPFGASDEVEYHKIKNFIALYLLHAPARVLPEFLLRYAFLPLLVRRPTRRRAHWRALAWSARHAPKLWRDRRQIRPAAANAFSGPFPVERSFLGSIFYRLAPVWLREARTRAVLLEDARRLSRKADGVTDPLALSRLAAESTTFAPLQREFEIVRFLEMMRDLKPVRMCEIGTASGGTSFLLSRAAPAGATLVTVDLGTRAGQPEALRVLAGSARTIHSLVGDSRSPVTIQQVKAVAGGPLDFLLIDGDHRYEGVAADFAAYRPLVRPGGTVAFHDIVPDSRSRGGPDTGTDAGGVPRFWQELKARFPGATLEIVERPDQDATGIGILQLPT
jgi:GT2 family glycosyltransferase/predicted O-methyltransferase YrrM